MSKAARIEYQSKDWLCLGLFFCRQKAAFLPQYIIFKEHTSIWGKPKLALFFQIPLRNTQNALPRTKKLALFCIFYPWIL